MLDDEFIRHLETLTLSSVELQQRSELRTDKITDLISHLIEPMNEHYHEAVKNNEAFEKMITDIRVDKRNCIERYEAKLERLLKRLEACQDQNATLLSQLESKDRQIQKLENILLSQLGHPNITVGDFNSKK